MCECVSLFECVCVLASFLCENCAVDITMVSVPDVCLCSILQVVWVSEDEEGNADINDLEKKLCVSSCIY